MREAVISLPAKPQSNNGATEELLVVDDRIDVVNAVCRVRKRGGRNTHRQQLLYAKEHNMCSVYCIHL